MKKFNHTVMGTTATAAAFVFVHGQYFNHSHISELLSLTVSLVAAGGGGLLPIRLGVLSKWFSVFGFGSMLPDIDIFLGAFNIEHRTLTHSLLFLSLLVTITNAIYASQGISFLYFFMFGVMISGLSHIFGDMLTGGVCLFYPYKKFYSIIPNKPGDVFQPLKESVLALSFSLSMIIIFLIFIV